MKVITRDIQVQVIRSLLQKHRKFSPRLINHEMTTLVTESQAHIYKPTFCRGALNLELAKI